MTKLLIFIGMTVGSVIGWWAGEKAGILTAIILSTIGSALGVYAGWRIDRYFLGQ